MWDNTNWYVLNQKEEDLKKENQDTMIATQNVSLSYSGKPLFKNVNIKFTAGNCYGIIGANGTGKSTFLKVLSGELEPTTGDVVITPGERMAVLRQNHFEFDEYEVLTTVIMGHKRLYEIMKEKDELYAKEDFTDEDGERASVLEGEFAELDGWNAESNAEMILTGLGISLDMEHTLMKELDGSQKVKVLLAQALFGSPDILLLDEPTKGLDARFKRELARILNALTQRGVAVLMVSHDIEFCARYAHRCALFFDGGIVTQDTPRAFFSGNSFYTTAANRMGRALSPQAVTPEDLMAVTGGTPPPEPPEPELPPPARPPEKSAGEEEQGKAPTQRKPSRRAIFSAALTLLLIPVTLLVGQVYLPVERYYFTMLLVLLECMLPFFLIFEGRKPQARELVLVAALCAIGVAGRAVLAILPQFKPVVALTVIAGVALGGETGFLVGAVTMLVSNALLMQGPWTPWQMFATGIIGFLAGLLFQRVRPTRLKLCCFGAAATILCYGGIMNFQSALQGSPGVLEPGVVASYYLTGFPMDCVHAVATWIFLWFGGEPMLEKLERVKVKYGLLQ